MNSNINLIYKTFWKKPKNPYYIVCPDYIENSSGILALHFLCHSLNQSGHESYVTSHVTSPHLRTPILTQAIKFTHRIAGLNPIVVYPEIISGNPLNAKTVVRYILNIPGLLGGDTTYPDTEILFAFRKQFIPTELQAELLWIHVINLDLFNSNDVLDSSRRGCCFYANKYLKAGGKLFKETDGFLELSHRVPRTLTELADIFKTSKMLYSYESSAACTQAMLCGCPIVYLPNPWLTEFPASELYGRNGAAWGSSTIQIDHAKSTVSNVCQCQVCVL